MNGFTQSASSVKKSNIANVFNDYSCVGPIITSLADYLIAMKEVTNLMIYLVDENINELSLVEHRNIHQDFPRNVSRIENTKYLAKNVIKSKSVIELHDTDFAAVSNKYGINIQKGFIGIPVMNITSSSDKPNGAVLVWTSYLNTIDQDRYNSILSASKYLSRSIEWNNLFAEDYNQF